MRVGLSSCPPVPFFFFFNDTAPTEIYPLSLHDALPISARQGRRPAHPGRGRDRRAGPAGPARSEEHTSELQSPCNLVCRLLLEKKKKRIVPHGVARRPPAPDPCDVGFESSAVDSAGVGE